MKRIFILLVCALISTAAIAQEAYTMKFLPQLQQSQWVNASCTTANKVNIGLPVISSFYFGLYNTGFSYNSVFKKGSDGETLVDPGDFISKLKSMNYIGFDATIGLFALSIRHKDLNVGFSVNDRVNFQFGYPKSFLKLLWNGNGSFIGQEVDFGGFAVNASYYREYALHASKQYKNWSFGISPKLLYGKTNINTAKSSLKLYTDTSIYGIKVTTDMKIQTSGIPDSAESSIGYLNNQNEVNDYIYNKQNKGLGLDLGVAYRFSDRLQVAAGVNNIGFINWKSNLHTYTASNKTFVFDGIDVSGFFQGDSSVLSSEKWADSVKKLVKFDKSKESYKTALPYEVYAMGNYVVGHHNFGLQLSLQRFDQSYVYAGTFCYQFNMGKHVTLAGTYTAKRAAAANIGGGLILQFLHMQWYFVSDNILSAFKPLDSRNANLHMGMNLVFGHKKNKDEGDIEAKDK